MSLLKGTTFQSTWLPLGLAGLTLIILNVGLYLRLASTQKTLVTLSLPYSATFDGDEAEDYLPFGGDWEVRDGAIVQISTTGADLGNVIPLAIPADQPYQFQTRLRFLGGSSGGGILFNLQQTTSRQQSHMVRFNVDQNVLYIIYGYFGDDSNFTGQGSVQLTLSPTNPDWHTLAVQVDASTYNILLDDQAAVTQIPVKYQGGAVGLLTSASQYAFDDIKAEAWTPQAITLAATNTPAPATTTMPATAVAVVPTTALASNMLLTDSFDQVGDTPSAWIPFAGDWSIENGSAVQRNANGYDFGMGYQAQRFDDLTLRVTLRHLSGSGGGLLFNMPQPESKNGAQMVRFTDLGDAIAWGYFDAEGNFVGVGSAPITAPSTDAHKLEVTTQGQQYSISLDNTPLASNISLNSVGGYIGLITSQSQVAYDSVEVLGNPLPATAVTFSSITGEWITQGDLTIQTQTEGVDYIAGTGLAAKTFSVTVDILLPVGVDNAGGGLVFQMAERDKPAQGYMVRFGNGGKEIFWGSYDAQGIFQGQGGTALTLTPGSPHHLELTVGTNSFDITVDGQVVASQIPLQEGTGYIALLSFSGPVTFSNFTLTPSGG